MWEVVEKPNDKNIIRSKWVFDVKNDAEGKITRLKARLVAMGNTQKKGFDYFETCSPTVDKTTLRLFLLHCLRNKLEVYQLDVESAFLQADIDQILFVDLPLNTQFYAQGKCLRLKKALYGLRQSNRLFNMKFRNLMESNGWNNVKSDKCIFMRNGQMAINHVDDVIVWSQ